MNTSFISFKKAVLYSLQLYPLMLAELILGNIAIIILSNSHSIESVGIFKILFNYYLVLKFIPEFFGRVIGPTLTKLYFDKDLPKIEIYYNFTFKISILFCSLMSIFFIGFIKNLLDIYNVYGSEYEYSMIILIGSNLVLTGSMIGGIYQAYNKPKFISLFVGLGSVTNLCLSIILIPKYGIIGACVSILSSNIISQIGLHYFALKKMKIDIVIKKFFLSLVLVLSLDSMIILLSSYNNSLVIKLLINMIMMMIYLIGLKFFRFFSSEELMQLLLYFDNSENKFMKLIASYFRRISSNINYN